MTYRRLTSVLGLCALFASILFLTKPASRATTLSTGPDRPVYFGAVQKDGQLLIGGDFTAVNGIPRDGLARLHADGTLDTNFNPRIESIWPWKAVGALPQDDGRIYIGGAFSTVNGSAREHLARLNADGTLDITFVPPSLASHFAASQLAHATFVRGKLFIGGMLLDENGTLAADFSAAIASHDPGFLRGRLLRSQAIASAPQSDGNILVVRERDYDRSPDVPVSAFDAVRLNADGTYDDTFSRIGLPISSSYYELNLLVQPDDKFFILGTAMSAEGLTPLVRYTHEGLFDPGFVAEVQGRPTSILFQDNGKILIADISMVNGVRRAGIASLFSDGALDLAFDPGTPPGATTILFNSKFNNQKWAVSSSEFQTAGPMVIQLLPPDNSPVCTACGSSESGVRLTRPTVGRDSLSFSIQTMPFNRYTLEDTGQVQNSQWHSSGALVGDGSTASVTYLFDSLSVASSRYFRLKVE